MNNKNHYNDLNITNSTEFIVELESKYTSHSLFTTFKDELGRNIIANVIIGKESKYCLELKDLNTNITIQSLDSSSKLFKSVYYYKDLLNKSNIKDFLLLTNIENKHCNVYLLNLKTKLFELSKAIETNDSNIVLFPNNNFSHTNFLIYNLGKQVSDIYCLSDDNTNKIDSFKSNDPYSQLYSYTNVNMRSSFIIECGFNNISIYDVLDLKEIKKSFSHDNMRTVNSVLITTNSDKTILFCSDDNNIYAFDYETTKIIYLLNESTHFLKFMSSKYLIGYGCNKPTGKIIIFDIVKNSISREIDLNINILKSSLNASLIMKDNKLYLFLKEAGGKNFVNKILIH